MKRRNNILYLLLFTALQLASCTADEPAMPEGMKVSFHIVDCGYAPSNPSHSKLRSAESGLAKTFTDGDTCGLYVVRNGDIKYANQKLIARENDKKLNWEPEQPVELREVDECYLYYPYRNDGYMAQFSPTTSEEDFFQALTAGWQPCADQSRYADYTASDLMTAQAQKSEPDAEGVVTLTFPMRHRMAMIMIDAPRTLYTFTYNTGSRRNIPPYLATTNVTFDNGINMYALETITKDRLSNKSYVSECILRYILRPGESYSFSGQYENKEKMFFFTADDIPEGKYNVYLINGGGKFNYNTYRLKVGDQLCINPQNEWYVVPKQETADKDELAGIVFQVDRQTTDERDYMAANGYAVATQDALYAAWSIAPEATGTYPEGVDNKTEYDMDWSGYLYTSTLCALHDAGAEHPAAHAAANHALPPNKSSGWFLPSIGQLRAIYNQRILLHEAALLPGRYWSSSEYSLSPRLHALGIDTEQDGMVFEDKKENAYRSRAIIGF